MLISRWIASTQIAHSLIHAHVPITISTVSAFLGTQTTFLYKQWVRKQPFYFFLFAHTWMCLTSHNKLIILILIFNF